MLEENNAFCSICGKGYYVCLSCKDKMRLAPYKNFTDTAEHYKVHQAVRGFSTGVYTKEEFKEKLKNIDLSDLDSYKDNIKKIIKDALKEDEKIDVMVEPVVEEPIVKPVIRKRNYKKVEIEAE